MITFETPQRPLAAVGRALPRLLPHPQHARIVPMTPAGLSRPNGILVLTVDITKVPVLIQVFHGPISQSYPHPRAVYTRHPS